MAKVTVTIDLPNVTVKQIEEDTSWFESGMLVIDEAYLTRSVEDDSFFAFDFEGVEDDVT